MGIRSSPADSNCSVFGSGLWVAIPCDINMNLCMVPEMKVLEKL
jgi:hypothetical protein